MRSYAACWDAQRPASRSSLWFIGRDSHDNWVVQDQAGLCGAIFLERTEALYFAMRDNGGRPRAVIMVPGILEFSVGELVKSVANNSKCVAEAKSEPMAQCGPYGLRRPA